MGGVRRGAVPEPDVDGWVEWCTEDDAWSYVPSLSCGYFAILVNRDAHWNVPYGKGEAILEWFDDEGQPMDLRPKSIQFDWCREQMRAACAYLAASQNHPNLNYVVGAADMLWDDLRLEDQNVVHDWLIKNVWVGHLSGIRTMWRAQNITVYEGCLDHVLGALAAANRATYDGRTDTWRIDGTLSPKATSSPPSRTWPTNFSSEDALHLNQAGGNT